MKFGGIAFLRDLPDLRDPVSESVSGVPTGVSTGQPGVNNFYCSIKNKMCKSINAPGFICSASLKKRNLVVIKENEVLW